LNLFNLSLFHLTLCFHFLFVYFPSTARSEFVWPSKIELSGRTLRTHAEMYSSEVKTSLNRPLSDSISTGEIEWISAGRITLWLEFESILAAQPEVKNSKTLTEVRNTMCSAVKRLFVETKFGGEQFGNCIEGAYVGYCLAHEAGFKNIEICESKNDHNFAVYERRLKSGVKLCAIDRFDLGLGNQFCGFSIKHKQLIHPKLTHSPKWYKKRHCSDPFMKPRKSMPTIISTTPSSAAGRETIPEIDATIEEVTTSTETSAKHSDGDDL
jgi:hypothetical protein